MCRQAHSEACSWGRASQRRNESDLKEACLFDVRRIIACLYTDGHGQAGKAKLIIQGKNSCMGWEPKVQRWGQSPGFLTQFLPTKRHSFPYQLRLSLPWSKTGNLSELCTVLPGWWWWCHTGSSLSGISLIDSRHRDATGLGPRRSSQKSGRLYS